MESLLDPEHLRDREGVTFHEETRVVERAGFDTACELDSHVVVGLTNDEGEVLLQNDGSHGWTVTAFPVESGSDWAATGRRGVEDLTGLEIELVRPERVRRVDFTLEGDADRRTTMYTVVFRASPVAGRPIAAEFDGEEKEADGPDVGWFADVPAEREGVLADDIRLFVE